MFDKSNGAETTINEGERVREQWIKESDAARDSFTRQYKEQYWADAILLKTNPSHHSRAYYLLALGNRRSTRQKI